MKTSAFSVSSIAVFAVLLIFSLHTPAWSQTDSLSGDYYGTVTVESPPGVSNIDLAFHLEASGGVIDPGASYTILEKTIVFPKSSEQVDGKDVGPFVQSGHLSAAAFDLVLQPFTSTVSGKTVTRQITLDNAVVTEHGSSITGTYTETMTGYLPNPITLKGGFVLVRPTAINEKTASCRDADQSGALSIEEIRAGGTDASVVEFEDITCAMCYYRSLCSGLTVSESTIAQAVSEYRTYSGTQP